MVTSVLVPGGGYAKKIGFIKVWSPNDDELKVRDLCIVI